MGYNEAASYDLMKISVVISRKHPDMRYGDVWQLAKVIYKKWRANNNLPLEESALVQIFAERLLEKGGIDEYDEDDM